jgi:copper resistance protein B
MKKIILKKTVLKKSLMTLLLSTSLLSLNIYSHENDDPILTRVMLDQLELRNSDGANPSALEGQVWIGKDLNKLWLKTDVERRKSVTETAEVQALYSHAITAFWDAQIGLRHDAKPTPIRSWGVIGLQGLAPYWFDIDTALFVGESGRIAARFSAEYELLLTQRLILTPKVEVNVFGQNDAETGTSSGLSDAKAGLRLRYEIRREFAPYLGVNWNKTFGGKKQNSSTELVKSQGESRGTEWVVGLRIWF